MGVVMSRIGYPVILLLAVLVALPCLATTARVHTASPTALIEVTSADIRANLAVFEQAEGPGYLRVAGRAEEREFLYATPSGMELLGSAGIAFARMLDDVSDLEIYIVPKTDDALGALDESGGLVLGEGDAFYLAAVRPGAALAIHMLPFKQRLGSPTGRGLPLVLPGPRAAGRSEAPLAYSPQIQAMVDAVSQSNLYARLSDLSGENDVTIGGEVYNIYTRYSPTAMTRRAGMWLMEQFDALGVEAEFDYFGFRTVMKAIEFPVDQLNGWAVGQRMTIVHTTDGGEYWEEQHWGTDGAFNDIDMWDNSNGCVVGNGGLVYLTTDGVTWQRVTGPTGEDLVGVTYLDALTLYCCGDNGVILSSTNGGSSWSTVSSPTSRDLKKISFGSIDVGWGVGESGRIIKTENGGASWSIVSSPVSVNLTDVFCISETRAWISGLGGRILLTTDGDTWQSITTPVSQDLYSVFFANSTNGWACGPDGVLMRSDDGGFTWEDLTSEILWDYRAVYFLTADLGWIIGGGPFHRTENAGTDWEYLGGGVQSGDVNVVATIPGSIRPDDIYIMCGHYDCTSQMPSTYAPGADDNGTGTIAALEAARVLKDYNFEGTLRFVCFSREEQGLIGSNAYCAEAYQRGDNIIAAINFDMIGYEDVHPEDIDIVCNSPSQWLGNIYQDALALYVPSLAIDRGSATHVGSDNSSFWDYGYSAFLGIEDYGLNNPYYHRTTDRVNTIDFDFYSDVVRGAVATMAEMAVLDTVSSSVIPAFEISGLRISPNPGRGQVTIEMAAARQVPEHFGIYDVAGRLVSRIEPEVASGTARAVWEGVDLAGERVGPGIYFLKVTERGPAAKIVLLK
jgi:photosystem II stability/assembly factor-like uncharacterized protein